MTERERHMKRKINLRSSLLLLAASVLMFGSATAIPVSAATDVTLTVTAVGKKGSPPAIKKEDIQAYQGKERVQVADWRRGENLFLAVLIDESLDSDVAGQWNDLKAFIDAQPQNTYVAIAYARNGAAM